MTIEQLEQGSKIMSQIKRLEEYLERAQKSNTIAFVSYNEARMSKYIQDEVYTMNGIGLHDTPGAEISNAALMAAKAIIISELSAKIKALRDQFAAIGSEPVNVTAIPAE